MDNNENFDYDMDEIEIPVLESLDGSDFSDEKPSVEQTSAQQMEIFGTVLLNSL